jgi:hypothetical protein
MGLDRVYIDNMNNTILSLTHPSTMLVLDRVASEDASVICEQPYQVFEIEASTLCEGSRRRLYDRIYADSCDVGFYLQSDRTGVRELFYLDDTKYERYEPLRWIFKPANQAIKMEIVVYND